MLLAVVFVLGVGNFALNRAVLESDHPLLDSLPQALRARGGRISLLFEFALLLGAMALTANAWSGAAWFYLAYSLANGVAGWMILGRRM